MPREGANNRGFSAPCFLAIYDGAAAEKNDAKQLLPLVLLRAVLRRGEVIPGAANTSSAFSRRDSTCQGCPQDSPESCESTAPAAQRPPQHHTLPEQRWAQRNLPNIQLLLPAFVGVSEGLEIRLAACLFVFNPGMLCDLF